MAVSGKPTTGKSIIYIVQAANAPLGAEALIVGNQTEGTWTREQETVDEQTKLGRIVGYGAKSETFELTLYAQQGDEGQKAIEWTYENESELKVWRVDISQKKANGKYDARFGYTIIENLEFSEPTDGFVEVSTSLPVLVRTVAGELELPDDFIQAAQEILFETPGETTGGFENRKQPTSTP
ncbi:phage major tail protein, TP901-1 family [Bacillus sp. JJ353]|uniref:phage major tail protein, TP901-1 family n=1 Tax=Bacillus TaxID=1386 RepID=UPI001C232294|nr:phage major tail protein, TP901-1 family [Bacillus glycinifermentans]MBU8788042.1 phage major tail protein, TP901-1 family [Bacillus glycinifermentans]